MPNKLMEDFIGKQCNIVLINDDVNKTGTVLEVEDNWIKIISDDKTIIINGNAIKSITANNDSIIDIDIPNEIIDNEENDRNDKFKYPEKTVILSHLGTWYKASFDSAYIVSFLTDYKLFEDPIYGSPKVGFPESSIDSVIYLLEKNKINYMLRYDDDRLIDFGEENNYDKFLHHDLPFSYVTNRGELIKQPKGKFTVQYENEKPEEFVIGENINAGAELVKSIEKAEIGNIISINQYNIKLIDKDIYYD